MKELLGVGKLRESGVVFEHGEADQICLKLDKRERILPRESRMAEGLIDCVGYGVIAAGGGGVGSSVLVAAVRGKAKRPHRFVDNNSECVGHMSDHHVCGQVSQKGWFVGIPCRLTCRRFKASVRCRSYPVRCHLRIPLIRR
jgi:hypothetical protein